MATSSRIQAADAAFSPVKRFYSSSRYSERRSDPGISDFTFGNPHELPLPGLVTAIRERARPHDKNWFAYKTSEEEPQGFLAEHVGRELGLTGGERLRGSAAGRHVLSVDQMARRRPGGAVEPFGGSQCLRPAWQHHERTWLFSNQPDRVRRNGRACAPGVPGHRTAQAMKSVFCEIALVRYWPARYVVTPLVFS
jgi:hypothetical protein